MFRIHAYIISMNWSQLCVTLGYDCYMMNRIRHNSPSLIHCLRAFHILFFAYLLFRCYCYNHYKTPKILLLLPLPLLSYYFATKHFVADIKFPGAVELTTHLLILENILWLPLCRINKSGLNTLPSKTVAIHYTCGLSFICQYSSQKQHGDQEMNGNGDKYHYINYS